jgi:hypothetical protein
MKKSAVLVVILVVATAFPAVVRSDDCDYERKIAKTLDLSSSEALTIIAVAGTLTIKGNSGSDEAVIKGIVCASKEDWLDESDIEISDGDLAKIEAEVPDVDSGWSFIGKRYARIDLEIQVPDHITLDVVDSSGSMHIDGVGALTVNDSSGSITIENTNGDLSLKDSSGSIKVNGIDGDLTVVSDSSGSIQGTDISGSVLVKKDSSGSIRFAEVGRDFIVEKDSSGSIVAEDIGGDFRVLKDGSGGIHSSGVKGEVSVPER